MTGIGIRSTFDYNCLAPADAASLREHANKLRGLIAKSTADMILVGRNLLAIKDRLEHGHFTVWVEHENRHPHRPDVHADVQVGGGQKRNHFAFAAIHRASIINRFSSEDVRFLANTLTWRVYDEFRRLVEGGVA